MALPLGDFCMRWISAITAVNAASPTALAVDGHSSMNASIGSTPRPSLPMTRAASR